ncbi:competence protein ComG [Bacillus sp. FJAT-27231]|uniref:competence type IV pilus ATPase ComGA n=1 Tax=Bacillus sp. FJAT-27231 TaxID=1679168 RepID=UPI0006709345|nr:competence type IV pilus ATPase ComGA [Bacillus sp. FJAT-27231]KMY54750.1 competence protein ComG [Bacillus sp. FJAT-27231]
MMVEKAVEELLQEALTLNSTDIHFIPRTHSYAVQIRSQGQLIPHRQFSLREGERLISHFKFMASMDIGEKRKPQSGSFQLEVSSFLISLRISTLPTALSKESLVIRLLPQQGVPDLLQLSLFPSSAKKLLALLSHSHGLIIFTGPTGSGKTTTLYSLIQHSASQHGRNVITLEDPVEKQNDQWLQVQVNEKAGVTYSTGLKAILRHDPDVIMVGEIRDEETARIAIRASLTGHLVLTTLHTRDAKGAIFRLLEFGLKWHEIQQTLIGVTAQRLVNLLCPKCGADCSPHCPVKKQRRQATVYEILSGTDLQAVLNEAKGEASQYHYPLLKHLLRKGIALGYLSQTEYDRWVFEEEKSRKISR